MQLYIFDLSVDYGSAVILVAADSRDEAIRFAEEHYKANEYYVSTFSAPDFASCSVRAFERGYIASWSYAE
jgi:hypothetical protein